MTQRWTDLTLSFLATLAAFFLSWPFWRTFEFWAESRVMWWVYFATGFLMAFYVIYAFIGCVRTLFLHDTIMKMRASGEEPPSDEEKPKS